MSAPKAAAAALALLVGACSQGSRAGVPFPRSGEAPKSLGTTGKIDHVVYIVQENRSFDSVFEGYPGADTVSHGKDSHGKTIPLRPVSLATEYEIDHSHAAMFAACDGAGSLPGTDCRMD